MVVANMIGAGVFISTGYMAQDLNPKQILAAWLIGTLFALAGAKAYSGIAQLVPQSGGEYRFLSTLVHPALGYLAGWASLLLGFSAPIALDAVAAGAFARTLHPGVNPVVFAALMIAVLTAVHAVGLRFSLASQNALVALKLILVVGFIVAGLIGGSNSWPAWTPTTPSEGFPLSPFMRNLFYVAFAFSGWNAAVYAASEFKDPKRDVPRALVLGCVIVGVLYLFVNWVFVANLTPEQIAGGFNYNMKNAVLKDEPSLITLGHLIMKHILGEEGAACMSVLAIIAFVSAVSAMTFLGPRVYAAMARDGFLPAALRGKAGKPPVGAVVLQGVIALFLVFVYRLQEVLNNVGAILTLFSALTVFSIFWVAFRRKEYPRPSASVIAAACCYLALAGVMLYFGFTESWTLCLWVGACILASLGGYFLTSKNKGSENKNHLGGL
jgi:APA family basic amino acid/polyamine antiporter